jgi:hypothetical protein
VWVHDWKSELLLFELGNDDRLRSRASDPLVGGLWLAYHRKSELLGNDDCHRGIETTASIVVRRVSLSVRSSVAWMDSRT